MKKLFKFLLISCLLVSLISPAVNVNAAENNGETPSESPVENAAVLNLAVSPDGTLTSTAANLALDLTAVNFNYYTTKGKLLASQQVAVAGGVATDVLDLTTIFTSDRYFKTLKVEVATVENTAIVQNTTDVVSANLEAAVNSNMDNLHISLNNVVVPGGYSKLSFVYYSKKDKEEVKVKATETDGGWEADVPVSDFVEKGLGTYYVKAYANLVNGKRELAKTSFELTIGTAKLSVDKANEDKATFRVVLKKIKTVDDIEEVKFIVKAGNIKKTYVAEEISEGKYIYKVDANDFELYQGTYSISAKITLECGIKKTIAETEYDFEPVIKNGWYYEKAYGKKYKYYYQDGKKLDDLTKILNLPTSNGDPSKYRIVINRAACVVNVFYYDEETKSYCIPVKSFTVSVGANIWSKAGAAGLTEDTAYTPLGTYSISSNGISTKYTVKEMHEPDGQILYARWASHIVGNVYFHSIAVGADSHYSLPASTFNRLGTNCSAGCIRMCVADAKWIYDYAPKDTKVIIEFGDKEKPGPYGKPATIKINKYIGYDPTDPEVPDSKKKKDYKEGKMTGYMKKSGEKVGY